MSSVNRFNLRVYGIIRNQRNEVLISDECRNGRSFTKFPGGGLEFGEGLTQCLERELFEEIRIKARIDELYYVNDFFQQSIYHTEDQLISFYYAVRQYEGEIETSHHAVPISEEGEKFRWIKIEELSVEMMTFPVDKIVVEKLKASAI